MIDYNISYNIVIQKYTTPSQNHILIKITRISLEIRKTLHSRLKTKIYGNNYFNSKRPLLQYTLGSKSNEETFLHQFLSFCHALHLFFKS